VVGRVFKIAGLVLVLCLVDTAITLGLTATFASERVRIIAEIGPAMLVLRAFYLVPLLAIAAIDYRLRTNGHVSAIFLAATQLLTGIWLPLFESVTDFERRAYIMNFFTRPGYWLTWWCASGFLVPLLFHRIRYVREVLLTDDRYKPGPFVGTPALWIPRARGGWLALTAALGAFALFCGLDAVRKVPIEWNRAVTFAKIGDCRPSPPSLWRHLWYGHSHDFSMPYTLEPTRDWAGWDVPGTLWSDECWKGAELPMSFRKDNPRLASLLGSGRERLAVVAGLPLVSLVCGLWGSRRLRRLRSTDCPDGWTVRQKVRSAWPLVLALTAAGLAIVRLVQVLI
jgi:hypothetical protein